jgi:threonine dehydratase
VAMTIDDIRRAADAIAGSVVQTSCLHSRTLSRLTGAHVFLKFENHQFTASFKERGALNRLRLLSAGERAVGVIAASAGNHAQGVAYHAQRLGIPAVIVMPRFTPGVKIERTREFGAEVILHGEVFDDARAHAREVAARRGLTFVHAYDDEAVIAGQGTIALEMLEAQPEIDVIVAPIGGGGLIAGVATAAHAVKPDVEVVGVQTTRFPSMSAALRGEVPRFGVSTIADGIAVKSPGQLTQPIIAALVRDVLLVEEDDIEQAVLCLLEVEKTLVEGAAAACLAAVMAHRSRFEGRRVGLVLSGGNIDPLLLAGIIERGLVRTGRLTRITVEIADRPGALAEVTECLASLNANIEEIAHQRAFTSVPVQTVEVDFVLQTHSHAHVREVIDTLAARGFVAALHPAHRR